MGVYGITRLVYISNEKATHTISESCGSLLILSTYFQFDNTCSVLSACFGSFVGKWTRKSCKPPISPCIMNDNATVVFWPGLITIEPMVGTGGQHPAATSM